MLMSGAKHLAFSSSYEDEILRLRLRMTLGYSLTRKGLKPGARIELNSVKLAKSRSYFFTGAGRGLRRTVS